MKSRAQLFNSRVDSITVMHKVKYELIRQL